MEDKKRTVYAVLVAVVLVLGLLYSFGKNLFSPRPQLVLPDPNAEISDSPNPGILSDEAGVAVYIEPKTVQSVIAELSRYESYSRTVYAAYIWGDNEAEIVTSQVWKDDGWIRTDAELQSGLIESSIIGPDGMWVWYSGKDKESEIFYSDVTNGETADLMQRTPTYEDVLELSTEYITGTGYVEYEKQPCIYIEAEHRELGYLYRYWISVNSGLLMAAETEKSGIVVYRMVSNAVNSPMMASSEVFSLPDGTILHYVD